MNVYAYIDAQGDPKEITSQDFTSRVQRIDTPEESDLNADAPVGSYVPCEIQIRASDLMGYDADLLARWGVQRVTVAEPADGQIRTGYTLSADGGGAITATASFEAAPPPPVPATISASQLKRFLRTMARTDGQAGTLRTQVDAMIAGSGDGDLQDYWAYTSDFHRDHPRLLAMVQAIHLTSDQVDAAFIAASQLT